MPTPPPTRSVKISADERGGWSSDRPRRDGAPPRPANLAVRCRVLAAEERLRYSPGSLLVVVSASIEDRDGFLARLIEDRSMLLSLTKVRGLLAGKLPAEQLEAKAAELLGSAVLKRLTANETVVLAIDGLTADEREPFVRMAATLKRPRHLILVETARDRVAEQDHGTLNELRRRLDAGELGAEGFKTALRLGGRSIGDVRGIVFQSAPRED